MVSNQPLHLRSGFMRTLFGPHNYSGNRIFDLLHSNFGFSAPHSQKSGFITKVFNICANKTGGQKRYLVRGYVAVKRFVACMDQKDLFPAFGIRRKYVDLPVKTA